MKTLIVQKKLLFPPESLQSQAGPFLQAVQQLVKESREQHQDLELELADIGFTPKPTYIEVKLYFREPAGRISEKAVQ